jgi:hypothetical protein
MTNIYTYKGSAFRVLSDGGGGSHNAYLVQLVSGEWPSDMELYAICDATRIYSGASDELVQRRMEWHKLDPLRGWWRTRIG